MPVVPTGHISNVLNNVGYNLFWSERELREVYSRLGISSKQWRKFKQTGKLKVSRKALAKIEVASYAPPEYLETLLRAAEARYETGRPRRNHEA